MIVNNTILDNRQLTATFSRIHKKDCVLWLQQISAENINKESTCYQTMTQKVDQMNKIANNKSGRY